MNWKIATAIVAVAAVVVAVILIADSGDNGGDTAQSQETDGAFMAEMTEHHEAAIEMAEIAQQRGEHAEVKQLADEIIAAQSSEIEEFNSISGRIFGEPVGASDHGTLGLPASQMGMHGDASALETENPFDRAFIDMMIPHHQGAIRMARIELEQGEDEELAMIAEAIIEAQSSEIEEMNRWRMEWYGAESPAGGVPAEGETETPAHETMGH